MVTTLTGSVIAASVPPSQDDELPFPTRLVNPAPVSLIQADTDRNRLFDDLEDRLARIDEQQAVEVVVRYRPGRAPGRISGDGRGERRLALDHSIATRLNRAEIGRLLASSDIESIEEDVVYHATRQTAEEYFGVTRATLDFAISGDGDGDRAAYSARDYTIAILDTGIDGAHQDFAGGKIIGWRDLVNAQAEPYDDVGHGTHCASIAAGAVNSFGVGGVAPGAALVGVKVLDDEGSGLTSTIAQGVEWCITNREKYGIVSLNLSLGGGRSSSGNDLLSRTVNRAAAAGIVVAVAAGNEGPASRTIGSPAAAANAIAVGSMADPGEGGFFLDPYSSRGPTADGRIKPDLCAPGFRISAARADRGSAYVSYSGTSMAAPFVAGVAALVRQADPGLTSAEVKAILKETAVHFGTPGENNDFGAGRLDAYAALARAAGRAASGDGAGPAVPAHFHADGRLEGSGTTQAWQLTISDTRFPVAATLIMASTAVDFNLVIFDPSGRQVARSATRTREELAAFRPTQTGVYSVVVSSVSGAGNYSLDVSAGAAVPLKEE
jgi:serine protease AprX